MVLITLLVADAAPTGARKRAREEDKEEGEVDPEAGEEEVAVKVACSHAHAAAAPERRLSPAPDSSVVDSLPDEIPLAPVPGAALSHGRSPPCPHAAGRAGAPQRSAETVLDDALLAEGYNSPFDERFVKKLLGSTAGQARESGR